MAASEEEDEEVYLSPALANGKVSTSFSKEDHPARKKRRKAVSSDYVRQRKQQAMEAVTRRYHVPLVDVAVDRDPYVRYYFDRAADAQMEERFAPLMQGDRTVAVNPGQLSKLFDKMEDCKEQIKALQEQFRTQLEYNSLLVEPGESLVGDVARPALPRLENLVCTKGFRLLDLNTLRVALDKVQDCQCARAGRRIALLELEPDRVHEDLATQLSLVCSICHKATVFPNSPFSEAPPTANYSINKHLMPLLGPSAYFQLAQFLQKTVKIGVVKRMPGQQAQLILSLDKNFNFSSQRRLNSDDTTSQGQNSREKTLTQPPVGLGSHPSSLLKQPGGANNVPPSPLLKCFLPPGVPPGSTLCQVPPGSMITGDFTYTSTDKSGLPAGVFMVVLDVPDGKKRYLVNRKATSPAAPTLPQQQSLLKKTGEQPVAKDSSAQRVVQLANVQAQKLLHLPSSTSTATRQPPQDGGGGGGGVTNGSHEEEEEDGEDFQDMSEFLQVNVD